MFFGGISYSYQSTLIKCPKSVNSDSYQKLVISKSMIYHGMNNLYGQFGWTLMQDGAPAHTSNSTLEYLSSRCNVLPNWPPNSPDLNPIENLWGIMGKRIILKKPNNRQELETIARDVWKNLEFSMIENLIRSMEKRLKLVVELEGECINGHF